MSANNSETVGHKDLRLGPIVYIIVFYNISFSLLLPLDGFQFNFLLRDSENDLYNHRCKAFFGATVFQPIKVFSLDWLGFCREGRYTSSSQNDRVESL